VELLDEPSDTNPVRFGFHEIAKAFHFSERSQRCINVAQIYFIVENYRGRDKLRRCRCRDCSSRLSSVSWKRQLVLSSKLYIISFAISALNRSSNRSSFFHRKFNLSLIWYSSFLSPSLWVHSRSAFAFRISRLTSTFSDFFDDFFFNFNFLIYPSLNTAVPATKNRNIRGYGACCAGIVRCLKFRLDEETQKQKLHVGKTRVFNWLKFYTNLSQSTIQHLLHDDDIPGEGEPETR
jgi:hypothetical protein